MKTEPLLYERTKEAIEAYRKPPVIQKLRWLEGQMEFFHKATPEKAKRIRDKLKKGELLQAPLLPLFTMAITFAVCGFYFRKVFEKFR